MNTIVRPLREADLPEVSRIFRVAFGTFVGAPEPEQFFGDLDYTGTRWRADPAAAFVAETDGAISGSVFATRWGSVGFFGPLTVRPDLWDRKIGQRLMEPVMDLFRSWELGHAGLITFAQSPKHAALYQRLDFWPGALTAVLSKPLADGAATGLRARTLGDGDLESCVAACAELTGGLYPGLDVGREIRAVREQDLGDVVLLSSGGRLEGFAVCHVGPSTEAGSGKCYVKFGAVRPGEDGRGRFQRLLAACEAFAGSRGVAAVDAGVNLACHEAYRTLLAGGYRTYIQGVAMNRGNLPGYHQPGNFVIDDWR